MAKKALYLFLTALLGMLLFFILHRLAVFAYLYALAMGYISPEINYLQLLVWDYFTLSLVLLGGGWYGVWLGLYWYQRIYEDKTHGGLADHIIRRYWPNAGSKVFETKVAAVKQRLEKDLWQLEDLAKVNLAAQNQPEPKVRRVIRKRAPKKLNRVSE